MEGMRLPIRRSMYGSHSAPFGKQKGTTDEQHLPALLDGYQVE